jgi:hypothetical protein
MSDDLLGLIDSSLPDAGHEQRHLLWENEQDQRAVDALDAQLINGQYSISGRYPATREDVQAARDEYARRIADRNARLVELS